MSILQLTYTGQEPDTLVHTKNKEDMKTTAKEFLQDKTLKAIDVAQGTVLSLVVKKALYGLDVDTSNIPYRTPVTRVKDFTIDGDTLTADGITLDLAATFMLGGGKGMFFDKSEDGE
jgi:hypothetical protein